MWLPLSWLHALGAACGYCLVLIPNRARDTTRKNLRACFPQKSDDEISLLTRKSLQNTACTAFEMGKAWLLPVNKTRSLVTQTEGIELFQQALKSGEGVILLAPHLSNFEIFGIYIAKDIESTFLYQPPKIPALDSLLQRTRSRGGIKLAPTNRKGVAQLLTALKNGELVGVLPDQVPTDEGGIYAPFFGEQALTMTLVSKLVRRKKVRVFCGYAERLPKARGFKVIVIEADQAIYSEDLETSVAGLNKTIEQCVERALTQYQWEYKRFRRQPGGKQFYQDAL
ncbi:MAG: lysophospholipid acyltransferase family protein [Proteobacteria bacterium]|nr:lysophospholipid acyltransferase family protein [Pseudomonadota bacterium]